ncbi:MAG: hypothetical protein HY064_14440 [Bacteroidetes bacterium]|nr:hypothetical protein [Bacteroidota bacterium]
MESNEDTSQTASNEKAEMSKAIKKKKSKGKTTRLRRMLNRLENNWPFAIGSVIVAIGIVATGVCKYGCQGANEIKTGFNNIKSYFNPTNTTYSKILKDPEGKILMEIVRNYYSDVAYGKFKATNYFASHVNRYILVNDLSVLQVDSVYKKNSKDFISPNCDILDSAFLFKKDESNTKTLDFWVKMTCFRQSRGKYESCFVRVEFVFDPTDKIIVLNELKYKDLKFSAEKG